MKTYKKMYLLSQDEYSSLQEASDDRDLLIKSIKGSHGQINNIDIGDGGRVVIKPSEISAKHVKPIQKSKTNGLFILGCSNPNTLCLWPCCVV